MPKRTVKAKIDLFQVRSYRDPMELQAKMNAASEAGLAITGLLALPGVNGRHSEVWLITKGFKLVEKEIDLPDTIKLGESDPRENFALEGEAP